MRLQSIGGKTTKLLCAVCLWLSASAARGEEPSPYHFPLVEPPVEMAISDLPSDARGQSVSFRLQDAFPAVQTSQPIYPRAVSHDAGNPGKPHHARPGDVNRQDCPPERYLLADCQRAGHPHAVAWWAKCSTNERYSAWYVGGGTPWFLPCFSRCRTRTEGTWGLDYDGVFRPRRVWLDWSGRRPQGGLGAYATDHSAGFLSQLLDRHPE